MELVQVATCTGPKSVQVATCAGPKSMQVATCTKSQLVHNIYISVTSIMRFITSELFL